MAVRAAELVAWVCLDPDLIENAKSFAQRVVRGDKLVRGSAVLAPVIGRLAEERAAKGEFTRPCGARRELREKV